VPDANVNLRTLPDGRQRWRLQYRIDGRQGVRTFSNEKAASRWLAVFRALGPAAALRLLDADDTPDATTALTVADAVREHLTSLTGVTRGTLDSYRREASRDILPTLGDLPLTALDRDVVSGWVNRLTEQGLAGKTIANRHSLLSATCGWAVERGHLPGNPCRGVRMPRTLKRRPVFLSPTQVAELLDALGEVDGRYRGLVLTLIGTGMRWSEATALQAQHVTDDVAVLRLHVEQAWKDTDSGSMKLGPPKTRAGTRTIPLDRPSPVADVIGAALAGTPPGGWLFRSPRGAVVRNATFHTRVWIPTMRLLTDRGWAVRPSVHDLRHTAASLMLAAGAEIHAVSSILGHEHVSTTVDVYGHFRPGAKEAALHGLGSQLAAALQ